MELLNCLCSAKADVRAESEKLISLFLQNSVITAESLNRGLGKLKVRVREERNDEGRELAVLTTPCMNTSYFATSPRSPQPAQQRDAGSVVAKICKGSTAAPAPASNPSATATSTGRRPIVEKKRPKKVAQPAAPRPQTDVAPDPAVDEASPNSHPFFGGAHVQNYSYGREYTAYSAGKEQVRS